MKGPKNKANVLYYYRKRWPAVQHARLGIGCSKLNNDVCFHLRIPDVKSECSCGEGHEDAEHFFMKCTRYDNIRDILKRENEGHCTFTFEVLLYSAADLKIKNNYLLFEAVHEYILESHRFD